ncbi:MAG TPA: helix-turn-helix domain-containing protein, partial [Hyphomicrobiales bacterium]|nr:helix-turn-helix domain-containing protein [Hyphomicrobiales bacterium]
LLLDHFLEHYCNKYKFPLRQIGQETREAAARYPWPGNVRELRHAVERAVIMSAGERLETHELLPVNPPAQAVLQTAPSTLDLDSLEKQAIIAALKQHGGNVSHAARSLGLTRASLYRRMEKHGL